MGIVAFAEGRRTAMLRRMRLPVTPSDLSPQTLRSLFERGDLHRPWRGVYSPTLDELDRIQALFRLLPAEARLADETAARWYGFGIGAGEDICVVVPQGATHNRLAGVTVRESALPLPPPIIVNEVPVLPPERVAIDLARMSKRMDALPLLDKALHSGTCTPEGLAAEVLGHKGLRGVIQARELVVIADPRPESVQESRMRLIVIDAGLPCPTPQLPVDYFRLDLGYEEIKAGMEYDGRGHMTWERLRADRRRMNYLASRGWRIRYFTDADIFYYRSQLVSTVRSLFR